MPGKKMGLEERMFNEIVESLMGFLISDKNQALIAVAAKKAREEYQGKNDGYLWQLLYSWSRSRQNSAMHMAENLKDCKDVIMRLQELIKVFIVSDGRWTKTSLNTRLIIHLFRAIDGVADDSQDKFYWKVTRQIKNNFKQLLQTTLHEHLISQEIAERKARELKKIAIDAKKESLGFVNLFLNADEAKTYALEHPQNISFQLKKESEWQLYWYDVAGVPNPLHLNQSTLDLLSTVTTAKDIENPLLIDQTELKFHCLQLHDQYLEKRKVLINPSAAALSDLKMAFVLKQTEAQYSLYWYNFDGECQQVPIDEYRELSEYLQGKKAIERLDEAKISRMIRQIHTINKVGTGAARQKIEAFFRKQNPYNFKCLINPLASEMAALTSTFVIQSQATDLSLLWYNSLGDAREIALAPYQDLRQWLLDNQPIEKADDDALMQLLQKVDVAKPMECDASFKDELERLLARGPRRKNNDEKKEDVDSEGVKISAKPINKIDMSHYEHLNRLFESKSSKEAKVAGDKPATGAEEYPVEKATKIDMSKYQSISNLFGHRASASKQNEATDAHPANLNL